jgi:tetratricopeptide (TPR) repeat protein
MPELAAVVAQILALEGEAAKLSGSDEVDSVPGPPASEAAIAAAEAARGVAFPSEYRAFLRAHDGWRNFAWGTSLVSTAQLTSAYSRGYLEDMEDESAEDVTEEMRAAVVIGASENDASLLLLCPDGSVMDWRYKEERRFPTFSALLANRAATLRRMLDDAAAMEAEIHRARTPKARAKADAKVARDVHKVLRGAAKRRAAKPPEPASKRPAAKSPSEIVARRGKKVVAEVALHLVLYLGSYPTKDEVVAAFRAWRRRFPMRGPLQWMPAGGFFPSERKQPEDEAWISELAASLRVDNGHFGLRASVEDRGGGTRDGKRVPRAKGRLARYIFNLRGVPPTSDDDELPRAAFCEVIVPAWESPAALHALARELLDLLPVRSGYAGYAAYVWDRDAEPDPVAEVFAWCRRWFGIEVGSVDGWLPGALTRLRGASWLTLLGPAFDGELARAGRLKFRAGATVERRARGTIVCAGKLPSLGDVQRGEFPLAVAEVERAIEPLLIAGYDERSWMVLGGNHFTTMTEDLPPFRSHRATAEYLHRLLDPAAFLAPTARERGEALLKKLVARRQEARKYLEEWHKEVKGGAPDFAVLMRNLYNASCGQADVEPALEALELAVQFPDGAPKQAMNNLLFGYLQRHLKRGAPLTRALELMPKALTWAPENPSIFHNAACIYARAGELAHAVRCAQAAHKHGYANMLQLLDDEDLLPLRRLAAYRRLRAKVEAG